MWPAPCSHISPLTPRPGLSPSDGAPPVRPAVAPKTPMHNFAASAALNVKPPYPILLRRLDSSSSWPGAFGFARSQGETKRILAAGRTQLRRKACLTGLLPGCVDIIDAFSPTCRESGRWLMHNTTYSRIEGKVRRPGWLQRLITGIHDQYLGRSASL